MMHLDTGICVALILVSEIFCSSPREMLNVVNISSSIDTNF